MAGRKPAGSKPALDPETNDYARMLRADQCAYCGTQSEHIDHIESVADGGALTWENLTAACGSCNQRKRTKALLLFLLSERR
jgi:5-methylcytosine-specific restriction endonuclease McrA